jgi:hypothetical protein
MTAAPSDLHDSLPFERREAEMNGDQGAMQLTRPQGFTSRLRNSIGFLFARVDWVSSTAAALRRRPRPKLSTALRGSRFWLLLGCAMFDTAWFAIWVLVAIRFHSAFAVFLASFPVLKWPLFLVAREPAQFARREQPSAAREMAEQSGVFQESSRHGAA